jgi:hypothetical protein
MGFGSRRARQYYQCFRGVARSAGPKWVQYRGRPLRGLPKPNRISGLSWPGVGHPTGGRLSAAPAAWPMLGAMRWPPGRCHFMHLKPYAF